MAARLYALAAVVYLNVTRAGLMLQYPLRVNAAGNFRNRRSIWHAPTLCNFFQRPDASPAALITAGNLSGIALSLAQAGSQPHLLSVSARTGHLYTKLKPQQQQVGLLVQTSNIALRQGSYTRAWHVLAPRLNSPRAQPQRAQRVLPTAWSTYSSRRDY